MKRIIATILVLLITVLLVSCNSTEDPPANTPTNQENTPQHEVVTLTLDNYKKYISTHIYSCSDGISNTYYCYNFVGSSLCKFNDVTIKYSYTPVDDSLVRTCVLNLSGCGQTLPYKSNTRLGLKIIEITGTVEILY